MRGKGRRLCQRNEGCEEGRKGMGGDVSDICITRYEWVLSISVWTNE